jgi:hypothetical protein
MFDFPDEKGNPHPVPNRHRHHRTPHHTTPPHHPAQPQIDTPRATHTRAQQSQEGGVDRRVFFFFFFFFCPRGADSGLRFKRAPPPHIPIDI